RSRQPGVGAATLSHVQTEDVRKIFIAEELRYSRTLPGQRQCLADLGDEILFVDLMQPEEEFGLVVEPGADGVEHRRHMLAHIRPVRATARKLDLLRRWEQARLLPADPFH